MHYTETKEIINNVLHYNKIMKHRTMTFLKEHPECADSLKLYFDATAINIENVLLQTVSMTGISKSTMAIHDTINSKPEGNLWSLINISVELRRKYFLIGVLEPYGVL